MPGVLRDKQVAAVAFCTFISILGDQLARVAVAVLLYGRTGSAILAAAGLAASYLPWIIVAPFLAGLGDRYSKRAVMVGSDVYRVVVAAALAVPGLPAWALLLLVFLLTSGDPPFSSARSALLPTLLGDRYIAGQSTMSTITNGSEGLGYAFGGLIVAAAGARQSLVLDAATFALSGAILRFCLLSHAPTSLAGATAAAGRGWALVLRNSEARWALAVGVSALGMATAPFGIIVPWAAQLGHGAAVVGLLPASQYAGAVFGRSVLHRVSKDRRARLMLPSVMAGALSLLLFFVVRSVVGTLLVMFIAGAFIAFQTVANQIFVLAIPPEVRSRAFGVAGSVIYVVEGLLVLLAGTLAEHLIPSTVVALAGCAGVVVLAVLFVTRPQSVRRAVDGPTVAAKRVTSEAVTQASAGADR